MKKLIGANSINLVNRMTSIKGIPDLIKKMKSTFQGKKIKPFEIKYGEKILEISAYYDKRTTNVTGVFRDITQRKKEETELLMYREKLEDLVKERTKDLENKNAELAKFNELFVGREFRIKELKEEIKALRSQVASIKTQ